MNRIIYSTLNDKTLDARTAEKNYTAADAGISLAYDNHVTQASMSWDGLLIADPSINIVALASSYMHEVARLACGECNTGFHGVKIIDEILYRLTLGQGREGDLALLRSLLVAVQSNVKCDFCRQAVKPVIDSLEAYGEEYQSTTGKHPAFPKLDYIMHVSAPCMEACPIRQDIPGYVELIRNRRYSEALATIRQTNCFPGITGRACVAFCEKNCVRNEVDQPVSIRALKRVPADIGIGPAAQPVRNSRKDRVAVIGAGPAGLAAARKLALLGYRVTVFDDAPSAGGMMAAGIPEYRLPRRVINQETAAIQALGIEFRPSTEVKHIDDMTYQYKSTIVATGAHISKDGGIKNWDKDLDGVMEGVHFLRKINAGQKLTPRKNILVIGGGNTAIDCARTALREGGQEVTIIYRRGRTEMPAHPEEIEAAEIEGVKLMFLALPVRIIAENGQVTGAECLRMELGEPDESGRRRPVAVKGSEFIIPAELVLTAIGESAGLSFLPDGMVEKTSWGSIKTDECGATSIYWLFAAGDCASGPASIVEAIAAGEKGADSVHRHLSKDQKPRPESESVSRMLHDTLLSRKRHGAKPPAKERLHPRSLLLEDRLTSFTEVEQCFDMQAAAKEAERCLRCYRLTLMVRK